MLERRIVRRRRVCLEGAITCGLAGPIAPVRVRNLSERGAEIVTADGQLAAADLELAIARMASHHRARVVWRRMDRFGLSFAPANEATESAAAAPADRLLDRLLAARAA